MKIAYLILTHSDPGHLNEMSERILNPNVDMYVHLDKKVDVNDFNFSNKEKIKFIEKREEITWGTNSIVKATMNLIEAALVSGKKYDMFCLLSGQDYPLYTSSYIEKFLEQNRNNNFIEIVDSSDSRYDNYYDRVRFYYPMFMQKRGVLSKIFKKIYVFFLRKISLITSIAERKDEVREECFFGSEWWILNRETVEWLYKYSKKTPSFLQFFENSLVPDEAFFQTLVKKSPYASQIKESLTLVVWENNKNNAAYLTISNLVDNYRSGQKIFGRKISSTRNPEVIEFIKGLSENEIVAYRKGSE